MAKSLEVSGGKKLAVALEAIAAKVTNGGALKVGFLEGATYPADDGGLPVATVAFWNEFGTVRAPPRPFFRTTIAEQSATWADKLAKAVVYYAYDGRAALEVLSVDIATDIRMSIARWSTPPNAPSTIAKKKFDKPLIDTGVMQRSVDYKVGE